MMIQTQKTNDSSIVSKNSASNRHYIEDGFLQHFVTKTSKSRSPLINRGYYIRMKAIDLVVSSFLHEYGVLSCGTQIVSLGAGFDTLYFRFKDMISKSNSSMFEIDFPNVISRKYQLICESQELISCLSTQEEVSSVQEIVAFKQYYLIGCDLTALAKLDSLLTQCGVDREAPTLFISECALTYIAPNSVNNLIGWMTSSFRDCLFCSYEQIIPGDGFGHIMKQHFCSLGSPLKNIDVYPSKTAQGQRMLKLGFSSCVVCDMNELYQFLPAAEKRRVDSLELFDEYEDFHLKCSHYTLMCALKGKCTKELLKFPPIYPERPNPFTERLHLRVLQLFEGSTPITRYGHSSVSLPNGDIIIIGGFGVSERSSAHKRLNDVLFFHKDADSFVCKTLHNCGNVPAGIMHHKAVLLKDSRILITGGRGSPGKPQQEFLTVSIESHGCRWETIQLEDSSKKPTPRWRHSAVCIIHQGKECVMIAGGCTTNCSVLCDIMLIQTSDWSCVKLPITLHQGTHSHSAVIHESSVIIAGGLSEGMVPLESCYRISFENSAWTLVKVFLPCPFTPRFSCGSCVHKDKLIVVGGVGRMENMELLLLDLKNGSFRTFNIMPEEKNPSILLQSFTIHSTSNGTLWLFGGGGNCFSFGTHFNCAPMEISL